jgi:hypothetical protein
MKNQTQMFVDEIRTYGIVPVPVRSAADLDPDLQN